jgi:hypothetical protein
LLHSLLWSVWTWSWLPDGPVGLVIGLPVALVAGGLAGHLVCWLIDHTYWSLRRRRHF